jgi:hypothetical protein
VRKKNQVTVTWFRKQCGDCLCASQLEWQQQSRIKIRDVSGRTNVTLTISAVAGWVVISSDPPIDAEQGMKWNPDRLAENLRQLVVLTSSVYRFL